MARPSKHNWRNLFLEYNKGRYKSVAEFARAKGLNPVAVRREFKKFETAPEEEPKTEQNETKQRNKTEQNKQTVKQKDHPWEALRKQFIDWPEERVQAYLQQIESRLEELKEIPFEEMSQSEVKELGKLRRERRAILSKPDPSKICKAVRNGKKCNNPVELGKEVCWNHGGAPGSGPPLGSKNGLKTGEHEAIWLDALEEDEQELVNRVALDPVKQVDQSIQLYEFRERRMLQRIQRLMKGLTESQRRVLQERRTVKEPITVYDEKTGQEKVITMPRSDLVVTEIEETEYRAIDDILNLEEALTRVQDKKIKAIDLKHRLIKSGAGSEEYRLGIEKMKAEITKITGDDGPTEDDGFMDAVEGKVEEVWDDEEA
ncbi:hypothetical protein [Desulfotomaculum sp. 1211_IL3151]|uniref:hypothetical protein n=1 Tax=Desulfotomaculum sp. 1211_IL3151 TaxID=3084055 RepID=UPI002FD8948B